MTTSIAPYEVSPDDLQRLRKLLVEIATHIVKNEKNDALASLKEIEGIVMREQQATPPEPPISNVS